MQTAGRLTSLSSGLRYAQPLNSGVMHEREDCMIITKLGEYDELYAACSRLDDARLLGLSVDSSSSKFNIDFRFDVTTNPGTKFTGFSLHCRDVVSFQFMGKDFNQFMLMSGYPDSLLIS